MKRGTIKRGFIQKLGVDLEGRKLRDSYTKLKKREKKKQHSQVTAITNI